MPAPAIPAAVARANVAPWAVITVSIVVGIVTGATSGAADSRAGHEAEHTTGYGITGRVGGRGRHQREC